MKKIGIIAAVAAAGAFAVSVVAAPASGLKRGEQVSAFHPQHVAGPLAGTSNCFPCTFQNRPQVQVWINGDSATNVTAIAQTLSKAMNAYKSQEFKALVVFLTDGKNAEAVRTKVQEAARKPELSGVGMALLDKSDEAVQQYRINTSPDVKNTVLAYRNWKVASAFVNLKADAAGLQQLNGAISGIVR